MLLFKRFGAIVAFAVFYNSLVYPQDKAVSANVGDMRSLAVGILGQDELLVNGIQYFPEYTMVTGSPEFESTSGYKSVLFIKGQIFENIMLAYDIVSDKPLLVQEYGKGLENRIELYKSLVDSFIIGNHLFINPGNFIENFTGKGYYEKVSSGKIMFLKKYRKTFLRIYDNSNRGKYSPQQFRNYLLNESGELIPVQSKSAFLNYYSLYKKNIRRFIAENNISVKNADKKDIEKLMFYCNSQADEIR